MSPTGIIDIIRFMFPSRNQGCLADKDIKQSKGERPTLDGLLVDYLIKTLYEEDSIMTTLIALKNRKAILRSCMEMELKADGEVSEKTQLDYELVLTQLGAADVQLLYPVDKCAQCKWAFRPR